MAIWFKAHHLSLTRSHAWNRALASRLGNLVLPAIINPFIAPFRRDRRRLHDIPGNTVVVRKPPSDEDRTAISAPWPPLRYEKRAATKRRLDPRMYSWF